MQRLSRRSIKQERWQSHTLPARVLSRETGISPSRTGQAWLRRGPDPTGAFRPLRASPRCCCEGHRRGDTHAHLHTPVPTGNRSCPAPLAKSRPVGQLRTDTRGSSTLPAVRGKGGCSQALKQRREKPWCEKKEGPGRAANRAQRDAAPHPRTRGGRRGGWDHAFAKHNAPVLNINPREKPGRRASVFA